VDLREIGWESVKWMHLVQNKGPVAGCCEHVNETSGPIKGEAFFDWLSDC